MKERKMEIAIDSNLAYRAKEEGCRPVVFMPDVDLFKLKDKNIITAF